MSLAQPSIVGHPYCHADAVGQRLQVFLKQGRASRIAALAIAQYQPLPGLLHFSHALPFLYLVGRLIVSPRKTDHELLLRSDIKPNERLFF